MQKEKDFSLYLALAGTLPFIACMICKFLSIDSITILAPIDNILQSYALVIAIFMAGSHWGNHLFIVPKNPWRVSLAIISNIFAIAIWLGHLILGFEEFLLLLIASYISLLIVDYSLNKTKIITNDYFKTRCYATAIVVVTLIIYWLLTFYG